MKKIYILFVIILMGILVLIVIRNGLQVSGYYNLEPVGFREPT